MLSATADYALRATLVLARTPGRPLRADEIAAATGAPRNYMAKTLNALARAGILTSARGPLGGFALAAPAAELTVARVIAPFEDARPAACCLLGARPCDPARPCTAHERWSSIVRASRDALAETSLASLLGRPTA
jgi:Rrf2 family transcriptional regulator, iron-sulfur cluster assembly transcription factor